MARKLPRPAYFDVNGEVHHGYVGLCNGVEIPEEEAKARCAAKRVQLPKAAAGDRNEATPSSGTDPRIGELMGIVEDLSARLSEMSTRLEKAEADGAIARAIWEEMRDGK